MLVIATIVLATISFIFGIFFDDIPIVLKKGIYSRETFWEGFNVSLNYTIFQIITISSVIAYYQKKNKITDYLEQLDNYRKFYKNDRSKVSLETFIIVNSLNKLKYNIKDLQGNFFSNGELKDITFKKTLFSGCDFTSTKLTNIYFYKCFFNGNTFLNCTLNNINIFSPQSIKNFNFEDTNVKNSKFRNVTLSSKINLNLTNSTFNNVIFESFHLNIKLIKKSTFNSCTFKNCSFENFEGDPLSKINSTKFENCNFTNKISTNIQNINSKYK